MSSDYKIVLKAISGSHVGEFINTGTLTEEFGDKTLSYTTYSDDASYETKIIIGKDIISVVNSGAVTSVINFEQGKTHDSNFVTEQGSLPVSITTSSIQRKFSKDELFLKIEYQTYFNNQPDDFVMEISAQKI